jgi:signal recognition particle GTPase
LLTASDTFRARPGERLEIWGNRNGVRSSRSRAASGAVMFDAIAAQGRGIASSLPIQQAAFRHMRT